jgi:hypothetical protein
VIYALAYQFKNTPITDYDMFCKSIFTGPDVLKKVEKFHVIYSVLATGLRYSDLLAKIHNMDFELRMDKVIDSKIIAKKYLILGIIKYFKALSMFLAKQIWVNRVSISPVHIISAMQMVDIGNREFIKSYYANEPDIRYVEIFPKILIRYTDMVAAFHPPLTEEEKKAKTEKRKEREAQKKEEQKNTASKPADAPAVAPTKPGAAPTKPQSQGAAKAPPKGTAAKSAPAKPAAAAAPAVPVYENEE